MPLRCTWSVVSALRLGRPSPERAALHLWRPVPQEAACRFYFGWFLVGNEGMRAPHTPLLYSIKVRVYVGFCFPAFPTKNQSAIRNVAPCSIRKPPSGHLRVESALAPARLLESPSAASLAMSGGYSTSDASAAPMEFGYWKIRGLGAVFRMIFEYKEAKYEDKTYETGTDWFKDRKPAILEMNPLANLPYLVDGDKCICQTNAILYYLGQKFGLNGSTEAQKLRTEELLCEIYDVRNGMIDLVYPFKNVCRDEAEFKTKAESITGSPPFAKFEAILGFKDNVSGGKWFVLADGPGVADFHIWEMLDQHKMLAEKIGAPPVLEKFPKCKAFYEAFRALPTLQKYFASDAYKFDVNNKIANAYFA